LIEVKSIPHEVPEIKAMIREFNDNPELKRVIATLSKVVEESDPLGNLITDAIRSVHHLDIAFHNGGGIRLDRLGQEVRLQDVYKMLPFGNDVVQFRMTAAEIKTLIKNASRNRKNDLKVSGIQYVVLTKPAGENRGEVTGVELLDETGAFLDENKTYKVGFNSYIASSYKFTHQDPGRALQTTIAQTLIDYLQKGGDVCKDIEKMRTHEKEVNQ
jgi:2',3'-cyclic-nucleotide 2'-phosphodiesterase (5'-nucleotidase family)